MSSKIPVFTLSNGVRLPSVGLGTWQVTGDESIDVVREAILAGYRHIDTATLYMNETQIGDVLAELFTEGVVRREDMCITTKAFCNEVAPDVVEDALKNSLSRLRLDYVDVFLAHVPAATHDDGSFREDIRVEDIWRGFEKLYQMGLTKAIGVSNFSDRQVERIIKIQKVPIHVSQLEQHLYFPQKSHRELCKKHKIHVTSYATLGSMGRMQVISSNGKPLFENTKHLTNEMEDEHVKDMAKKYNKTPAQIILRATVELGMSIIPKSSQKRRIRENINLFDFSMSPVDIDLLDSKVTTNRNRLFWFPNVAEHPEDPFAGER